MDRINQLRVRLDDILHQKNAVTDILKSIEVKTKVKRLHMVLGFLGLVVLYLIFGYGSSFLATLIGFVYPAYKSIKALETNEKEDDTKWLTYWVVFAAISVVEAFTDIFFYWIPLYSLMKCALFLFMMLPTSPNGSMLIYSKLIRPYFLAHQNVIDKTFGDAEDVLSDFGDKAKRTIADAAVTNLSMKED